MVTRSSPSTSAWPGRHPASCYPRFGWPGPSRRSRSFQSAKAGRAGHSRSAAGGAGTGSDPGAARARDPGGHPAPIRTSSPRVRRSLSGGLTCWSPRGPPAARRARLATALQPSGDPSLVSQWRRRHQQRALGAKIGDDHAGYGWIPVRPASDRRVPNHYHRQAAAAIGHQGELTQGSAVCQTDRRCQLRRGPIGFTTGWPLRNWLVRQCVR
jgi:hypothetical protein